MAESFREQVQALRDEMFENLESPDHMVSLDLVVERLDALLSQPTPSADPCPDCKGTGESLDSSRRHSGLPTVGRCDTCGGTGRAPAAAPPRIEDMAPGTRCREEVPGTVPSWAGEDQISPCLCVLDAGHDGRHRCDHQVDPSTIRDVTPPEVTS